MTLHSKILAVTALSLASMITQPALSQDDVTADTVLATINGKEITIANVIALRSNLPPHYDQLDSQVLFDGILDQLVQHEILSQSLEDGPTRLTELTIENEIRAIRAAEATDLIVSAAVADEDVQAAYDEEYLKADPETEYNAAHILVETEDQAKDLVTKLSDGTDFAELAREFSTGPSGPSGGQLGWFGKGVMVEPFFEAVVGLNTGEVSDPVQTQFGWHVIKLVETRALDRPALEDVREQIEGHLREEAFENHMKMLETKGTITRTDTSSINADIISKIEFLEQ